MMNTKKPRSLLSSQKFGKDISELLEMHASCSLNNNTLDLLKMYSGRLNWLIDLVGINNEKNKWENTRAGGNR